MRLAVSALVTLSAALPGQGDPPKRGPVHHHHKRRHHHKGLWQWKLAPGFNVDATAYCYGSSTTTAAGGQTHFGVVASNTFALGTTLALRPPIRNPETGEVRFLVRVLDRVGSGSALDVWLPGVAEPDCGGTFPRGERVNRVVGRRR